MPVGSRTEVKCFVYENKYSQKSFISSNSAFCCLITRDRHNNKYESAIYIRSISDVNFKLTTDLLVGIEDKTVEKHK